MDQAVGSKIADYLIKPVNPSQILLSIKKNLHSAQLVSEKSSTEYRQDFGKITSLINDSYTLGLDGDLPHARPLGAGADSSRDY